VDSKITSLVNAEFKYKMRRGVSSLCKYKMRRDIKSELFMSLKKESVLVGSSTLE
jgi:hypothetical protein